MKKLLVLIWALSLFTLNSNSQILKSIGNKIKNKAGQKTEQPDNKDSKTENSEPAITHTTNTKDTSVTQAAVPGAFKVYQNYDFVPGDKILFEDNFIDDQDGEFPTHWELKAGQAVLNKLEGAEALYLTEGNYVRLLPRIKVQKYLTDIFTIEFDYYYIPGAYSALILLKGIDKEGSEHESGLYVGNVEAAFNGTVGNVSLNKQFSEELKENFENKWHHVSIAVKNHQLKVYVDQFRTLVVPDTKEAWTSLEFAGIGDEKEPIIFKNVRIASGGNMNMLGKKFTEAKIVTHGINFDVNKATIKPESMGTLNMIVQVMKDNPDIKFEVGGYTDSDGADDYNLKLSQQRSDAVKDQLIKMGVDAPRLTAKGYGETKPISDNTSLEGKANNRRVEFVKK